MRVIVRWVNRLFYSPLRHIIVYSNIIQRDSMGYPLRLVIMSDGEQIWIDSYDMEGDVELVWREV